MVKDKYEQKNTKRCFLKRKQYWSINSHQRQTLKPQCNECHFPSVRMALAIKERANKCF